MQKIVMFILCLQFSMVTTYGSLDSSTKQEIIKTLSDDSNESAPRSNKKLSRTQKIILLSAMLAGGVIILSYAGYHGIKWVKELNKKEPEPEEQPPVYNNLKVQIGATVLDVASEHFLSEPTGKKASHLINRVAAFIDKLEDEPTDVP